MLPRNAFNAIDWAVQERPGQVILRPGLRHAFFRFWAGSGFFALITLGLLGLDHELRGMRERRRLTDGEVAVLDEGARRQADPFIAAGNPEQARKIMQDAEAFKADLLARRTAEIDRLEAAQKPWHTLLRVLAGIAICVGILLPLSPLWQRIRITRIGRELVFHRNILPRTRRIHVDALAEAHVHLITARFSTPLMVYVTTHHWLIVLPHGDQAIQVHFKTSPQDVPDPPACVGEFLQALGRLRDHERPK